MQEKSEHQQRVEKFMVLARQVVPSKIVIPDLNTRKLRAKLILEEALETISALGCKVVGDRDGNPIGIKSYHEPNLEEVIDGCCDLKVVTTGTLSAFGVKDLNPQLLVDQNNLDKFKEGSYMREDGKWIKPPGHKAVDWAKEIERQNLL